MRLIIDHSSVFKAFMFLRDDEFGQDVVTGSKTTHVPDVETSLERAEASIEKTLQTFDLQWRDIITVLDPESSGQARRLLNKEYRTGREKRPKLWNETWSQLEEKMKELIMAKGGVACTPNTRPAVEADDLINQLCIRLEEGVVLWARDKDLLACPATYHYQDGEINPEKFPAEREDIVVYRCLVSGDKSDNIGSCKGFGDAAWTGLIQTFGYEAIPVLREGLEQRTLHQLEEDVADYPPLQKILDQREQLYENYELMAFMPVPAHRVIWEARYPESYDTLVVKHNFEECKVQITHLLTDAKHVTIDYETDVPKESREWCQGNGIKVDVMGSEITGMGLRVDNNNYYFCVDHADTDNIELDQLGEIIKMIEEKKVVAHNATGFENVVTYNHFGMFHKHTWDTTLMASYVQEEGYNGLKSLSNQFLKYEQTSYAETIGDRDGMRDISGEEVFNYGIDDVAVTDAIYNLFLVIMQYEGTLDAFRKVELKSAFFTSMAFIQGVPFNREAYDELVAENAEHKERMLSDLKEGLKAVGWVNPNGRKPIKVRNANAIRNLYYAVTGEELEAEGNTVKALLPHIDNDTVKAAVEAGAGEMDVLYETFYKEPELPINFRSPKQMNTLLYETLKIPVRGTNPPTKKMRKEGKKGSPKTDEHAIENAIAFGDVDETGKKLLKAIIEYKECLTRDSLFYDKYPGFVHWKTGRLHSSQRQCGTSTRRHSHSAPNGAQLPKKKGKKVRNMLMAPEGYTFLDCDIDSQELKSQAWESQCPQFLACYTGEKQDRKDVHSSTGFYISELENAGISNYDEFKELRASGDESVGKFRGKGKTTNFATAYLCTNKTLGWQLRTTEKEAAKFVDAKAKAFPGLMPATAAYINKCRKRGYARTRLGARRHLYKAFVIDKSQQMKWKPNKKDHMWTKSDRLAWSFRIQGSSAEEIKIKMGRIVEESNYFEDDTIYPALQIHDEVVLMVRDEYLDDYVPAIEEIFREQYADQALEASTTPEVGKEFGKLKAWGSNE